MVNTPSTKQRGAEKLARIPIKVVQESTLQKKPDWIRIKVQKTEVVERLKAVMRQHNLVTVCEEASCPNLHECFSKGTATFMIMGDKCTRRCAFCDVGHGRPEPLDPNEPRNLANMIQKMELNYIVITSVDRDDLRDGGAAHFSQCILAIRAAIPHISIEVLVPDFRGRRHKALEAMSVALPDVFNHNVETVPRLYKQARPGSDYQESLYLLQDFKRRFPNIRTKSGLMLGLGETLNEVRAVMHDLRDHEVDMLTLGQYLAPSRHHLQVVRYVTPEEFRLLGEEARQKYGFTQVASGPLVRSSYHADQQAAGDKIC